MQSVDKTARIYLPFSGNHSLDFFTANLLKIFTSALTYYVVLSRGRPLFLTQIEWDLILFLTSDIKVRKRPSFGHYMCSEYISVVQTDEGFHVGAKPPPKCFMKAIFASFIYF